MSTTHTATPKVHSYTVTFPVLGEDKLSDDPTVLDAEIEALEARLVVLRAAKAKGPKQEYPKWVHKPVTKEPHVTIAPHESKIVHSKAEEDALGSGWYDPTSDDAQKKAAAAARKDA